MMVQVKSSVKLQQGLKTREFVISAAATPATRLKERPTHACLDPESVDPPFAKHTRDPKSKPAVEFSTFSPLCAF